MYPLRNLPVAATLVGKFQPSGTTFAKKASPQKITSPKKTSPQKITSPKKASPQKVVSKKASKKVEIAPIAFVKATDPEVLSPAKPFLISPAKPVRPPLYSLQEPYIEDDEVVDSEVMGLRGARTAVRVVGCIPDSSSFLHALFKAISPSYQKMDIEARDDFRIGGVPMREFISNALTIKRKDGANFFSLLTNGNYLTYKQLGATEASPSGPPKTTKITIGDLQNEISNPNRILGDYMPRLCALMFGVNIIIVNYSTDLDAFIPYYMSEKTNDSGFFGAPRADKPTVILAKHGAYYDLITDLNLSTVFSLDDPWVQSLVY